MTFDPEAFLTTYGHWTPWMIFSLTLLAGCGLPISIDLLVALSALIAAQYMPETWLLFYTLFTLGCIFAAWIAYSIGRFSGRLIKSETIKKAASFHTRFGPAAFFICRFIPFGVRNLFFASSGLSKYPFPKFALLDALACTLWSSLLFFSIFYLGKNLDTVLTALKHFNIVIFSLFSLGALILFFRFRAKRRSSE